MGKILLLKGSSGKVPVTLYQRGNTYHSQFPFDLALKDHIKAMKGARWRPEEKEWTFTKCARNDFQLAYLLGLDPYVDYDKPLIEIERHKMDRSLFEHQWTMLSHMLTRRYCIVAAEMGTGKTLAGIEAIERISPDAPVWWVGPKLTLSAIRLEFKKWNFDPAGYNVKLVTYDWVKKVVKNKSEETPQIILWDESTRLKTHSTDRTKYALQVTDLVRAKYGQEGLVALLSGRPAPNSPGDWWAQCEVACPGFLKEGKFPLFVNDLQIQEIMTTAEGVSFPKHITWLDDPHKCKTCGQMDDDHFDPTHSWTPSQNKIARLEERLKGLVLTVFKRDCLDLPEKNYRKIYCPVSDMAKRLQKRMTQVYEGAELMNRLRQLSDGFQYEKVEDKKSWKPCKYCVEGTLIDDGETVQCQSCDGHGKKFKTYNKVTPFDTPKTKVVAELLAEFEDYGRFVIYAPMYGSLDRVKDTAIRHGWEVIKFDGRGVVGYGDSVEGMTEDRMLEVFQEGPVKSGIKRLLFLGNQESAAMGFTLTASPALAFYANSFKPEPRQQGEDRIHRPGADENRGVTIIDIIHLPQDDFMVEKLRGKSELQDLSLGKLDVELKEYIVNWEPQDETDTESEGQRKQAVA